MNGGYDLTRDEKIILIKSQSNGQTDIASTGTFRLHCSFDPSFFPFDSQVCIVQIESSRYVIEMQTLHVQLLMLDNFVPNDQWEVGLGDSRENNVTFTIGTFSLVEFDIKLKRKVSQTAFTIHKYI